MRIVGTHDEIMYFLLQCQTKALCDDCVLKIFCRKEKDNLFMRMKPSHLDALETGKFKPMIITKGDDMNASKIQ